MNRFQYLLIIASRDSSPAGLPNGVHQVTEDSPSALEIIGALWEHKAVYVQPHHNIIPALRSVSRSSPIDIIVYMDEDELMDPIIAPEVGGLPVVTTIPNLIELMNLASMVVSDEAIIDVGDNAELEDLSDGPEDAFEQGTDV
uniref:Uncharacterized protein n=1 Tax=viral metagenome TaxID=1070528 RepID=A0A2V0RBC3_9ZZZZ